MIPASYFFRDIYRQHWIDRVSLDPREKDDAVGRRPVAGMLAVVAAILGLGQPTAPGDVAREGDRPHPGADSAPPRTVSPGR